jgi:hypothetical protein
MPREKGSTEKNGRDPSSVLPDSVGQATRVPPGSAWRATLRRGRPNLPIEPMKMANRRTFKLSSVLTGTIRAKRPRQGKRNRFDIRISGFVLSEGGILPDWAASGKGKRDKSSPSSPDSSGQAKPVCATHAPHRQADYPHCRKNDTCNADNNVERDASRGFNAPQQRKRQKHERQDP